MNQDMKPEPSPSATRTFSIASFAIVVVVLVAVGALFSLVLGVLLVMSSDSCGGSDTRLICSADGQSFVFVMPLLAWLVATVASLVGRFVAVRRGFSPWWFILLAACLYVVIAAVAVVFAL